MGIAEKLSFLRESIPSHIKIVAVTKTQPLPAILEAYHSDQRIFGENRVLEMADKQSLLPADVEWHFIGHLQTNKVKYMASFVRLIHSVDSMELLEVIDREAAKHQRVIPCLLQIRIALEETKYGMTPDNALTLCRGYVKRKYGNIVVRGLMGMATFTDDMEQIRKEFSFLASFFRDLKENTFRDDERFCELSMGMSGDYELAIREGATMVRLGSLIFGERSHH